MRYYRRVGNGSVKALRSANTPAQRVSDDVHGVPTVKLLLVNPLRFEKDNHIFPPVHLLYIAQAARRAGAEAEIVDLPYLRATQPRKFRLEDDSGIDYALQRDFDVLGIGSVVSSYFYAERIVKKTRQMHPDKPVIVGGSLGHPAREVWAEHAPVDYLCEGDGELVIEQFLKTYPHDVEAVRAIPGLHHLTESGTYIGSPPELPKNLDYIPFVTYDEVDIEYFMAERIKWIKEVMTHGNFQFSLSDRFLPIIFSRGCVYDCTFCFHFDRSHRRHSATYIADNVDFLMERYGATAFAPLDDLTIINKKWLTGVCDEIIGRGIETSFFSGGGKPSVVDAELLTKMKRAGFKRVSYGVESGSQTMLDVMNKRTTVEDNKRAIRLMQQVGMPFSVNIVMGMPGETLETMNETRDFLIDVDLTSKDYSVAYATPYPGTELFRMAQRSGIVGDTHDYLLHLGGCADYRYNLTDIPSFKFLNHVLDIAYRVDLAHYLKRRMYAKAVSLVFEKYARIVYHRLLPPDVRGKIRLRSRLQPLLRLLPGQRRDTEQVSE